MFDSHRSYRAFADSIKSEARYVFEPHVERFLEEVVATSGGRTTNLPANSILYRAQRGHGWLEERVGEGSYETPCPLSTDRMKPRSDSAREGRVNPKGIPCLYLATDQETAMAEVRPWLASYVSVAQFTVLKDLRLIDCSKAHDKRSAWFIVDPQPEKREGIVWADIDHAFSRPVEPDDSTAEYAPTQVLAELFRKHNFDGVVYKSLLGAGYNVALFEVEAADMMNCGLFSVDSITFHFDEVANRHFVTKYYPPANPDDGKSHTSATGDKRSTSNELG